MARRRCPLCDALTDDAVCPRDRMATLLAFAPPSQAPVPAPGMVIGGRYELERSIGRGGHGQVFQARHLGTGQAVALKIMVPPHDSDEDFAIKRFFLEARATSGLAHPNTVRVFDFGQDDSSLVYLALELLTGRTLRQELKARKAEGRVFTEKETIDIAAAVTKSLGEAHAAGIVHRDLKPDNVFLHQVAGDEPVVKVLDFGIAKLGTGLHTLSTTTSVPGTPAYMSPEQAMSSDVDGRSDLYSLGVMMFQLVTGELPFKGPSDPQTLYMHAYQPPPDLRSLAKVPISDRFVSVVSRALEKDRARRFADARQMREALFAEAPPAPVVEARPMIASAAAIDGAGPTPLTTARVTVAPKRSSRRRWIVGMAFVAFAIAGAALTSHLLPTSESPQPPAPAPKVVTPPPPPPPPVTAVKTATVAPPPVTKPIEPPPPKKKPVKKKKDDILERRLEDLVEPKR